MKLAFMHIPKTGGISVERTLKAAGGESLSVCPAYSPFDYTDKQYDELPGYDLYIGHFRSDFAESMPEEYLKATVIRRPMDLLLSLYNHVASRPAHRLHDAFNAEGATFSGLLAEHRSLHNTLTKYILGHGRYQAICTGPAPMAEKTAAAVAAARDSLATFDVVGVTTRLNGFVQELGTALGTDLAPPKRENTNPKTVVRRDDMTEEELSVARRATRFDQAVFAMAWQEFVGPAKPDT